MADNVNVIKLRTTLAELQAELRQVDELDGETRTLLESAVAEIETTLRSSPSLADREPTAATTTLRGTVESFEGSHPTLAQLVHRVVDLLNQLGI